MPEELHQLSDGSDYHPHRRSASEYDKLNDTRQGKPSAVIKARIEAARMRGWSTSVRSSTLTLYTICC
jgi:hypothetical protein